MRILPAAVILAILLGQPCYGWECVWVCTGGTYCRPVQYYPVENPVVWVCPPSCYDSQWYVPYAECPKAFFQVVPETRTLTSSGEIIQLQEKVRELEIRVKALEESQVGNVR